MATETQAEIDRINTEVATQADKIAQLSTILDGKAGGGGGIETSTVTINATGKASTYLRGYLCTVVQDGEANSEFAFDAVGVHTFPLTFNNVVRGSYIMLLATTYQYSGITGTTDVELIASGYFSSAASVNYTIYRLSPNAGATVEFTTSA